MATGAIRLLAREHGEENTVVVVKSEIAPLARREFPSACVESLPRINRRVGGNRTAANLLHSFPVWRRLRRLCVDHAVCFRSRRTSVHALLFAAPRAGRFLASENVILQNGKFRKRFVEWLLLGRSRTELLSYPASTGILPRELASHRCLVAASLGRVVSDKEIYPLIVSAPWKGGGGWLLCPFSSRPAKDYAANRWCRAIGAAVQAHVPGKILLAGGPDQARRLEEFAGVLTASLPDCPVEVLPPSPLEHFPDQVALADLVLTVDTAAAHFACAVGAPAVIVACGLHDGTYGPYSPNGRQTWVVGDWAGRGRDGWQETVPPREVAAAISRALKL